MSNDQLGWEQILISEVSAEKAPVLPTEQSEANASPAAPAGTSPKSSSRRKKPADNPGVQSETQYAKKNWGKLEFQETVRRTPDAEAASFEAGASAPDVKKAEVAEATATTVRTSTTEVRISSKKDEVFIQKEVTMAVVRDRSIDEMSSLKSPEPDVMSVSELNRNIRDILEGRFPLLWLKAEISNFKAHTSGHFYFSLKDAKAQISAVMFRGFNSQLRFRPEDGMEVLVRGKVTVYEPRGNYQIFCELMEPVGAGALQKAYEQLKARLQKEGLFDEARKRPLPSLPKHIAIVTSPTGAAIRDMLNVLSRRFKGADITLVPCKVQGDAAPREICAAIALVNRLPDVDVMIVGRGGGSIEDLWAFNDENVARAIAGARVPVISAVGHEVDFTIADFVADLRAPTPSAAAELVVKNAADLQERIAGLARGLRFGILRRLNFARQESAALGRRLVDPQRRIQDASQRCDELLQRLQSGTLRAFGERRLRVGPLAQRVRAAAGHLLARKHERVARHMAVLDTLSPLKVLDRGFSMVIAGEQIVTHARDLQIGQNVTVRMCAGSIEAKVTKVDPDKR